MQKTKCYTHITSFVDTMEARRYTNMQQATNRKKKKPTPRMTSLCTSAHIHKAVIAMKSVISKIKWFILVINSGCLLKIVSGCYEWVQLVIATL